MRTNRIIWNIGRYMCLALLVATASSCIRDEFVENETESYEKGLCFSLYADGDMQLAGTRSAGVDDLNENRISSVDLFLFKNDGSLNTDGYAHANVTTSDEVVYLYKGSDWLSNFKEQDGPYTVYALANYKGDAEFSNVQSLDDLKAVVAKDEDVVKWEGMGSPAYEGKTFLMDGKQTVTYAELQSAQGSGQPYVANVPVSRAAVKIELTLNFSEDWATKFMATGLEAQLSNYASITPALTEGNPLDGDQRGLINYPGLSGEAVDNFSSFPVFFKPETTYSGSKIRFYTYVNRWDDFINNETMLLIDLPGRYDEKGNPSSQDAVFLDHNFYKVPIISNVEPQVFQRNTFYQITAVVDMKGTETVDVPVELTDVQFKTAPWNNDVINVGEGDTPSYLVLSESHVDIRNVDGYDGLEFYSSSPITSVVIVGFKDQTAATEAGVDFIYPGDGTTIPGAFFVNKDNERQKVDLDDPNGDDSRWDDETKDDKISVEWDRDVTKGKIYLTSTNPENVTKRYITLAVTNEVGTRYVVVEQYPLEYIQPIAGYYSYRDDLKSVGGTYETKGTQQATWYRYNRENYVKSPANNKYFLSKVFVNNQILGWYWMNNQIHTADGSDFRYDSSTGYGDFPDNNMMYFVTITQTNDKYKIAHPITVNESSVGNQLVAVDSEENNHFVSPSFMLASQLGTVYSSYITGGWEEARKHCAYYVETYTDENNKTIVLDDWRLPTTDEINVIVNFQDETPGVMAEVLTGTFYYVAYSKATENKGDWWNTQPLGTAFTGKRNDDGDYEYTAAVRCIRDVKPTDAFLQSNN